MRKENQRPSIDERLYQIACSFHALRNKGVDKGHIPGISPHDFYDQTLSKYLYHGGGGMLSHGERLLLEFLLNLYNPLLHDKFNLGDALQVLDDGHMAAMLEALCRMRGKGGWE